MSARPVKTHPVGKICEYINTLFNSYNKIFDDNYNNLGVLKDLGQIINQIYPELKKKEDKANCRKLSEYLQNATDCYSRFLVTGEVSDAEAYLFWLGCINESLLLIIDGKKIKDCEIEGKVLGIWEKRDKPNYIA